MADYEQVLVLKTPCHRKKLYYLPSKIASGFSPDNISSLKKVPLVFKIDTRYVLGQFVSTVSKIVYHLVRKALSKLMTVVAFCFATTPNHCLVLAVFLGMSLA